VDVVSSEIQRLAQKREERLHHHENAEAIQLVDNMGIVMRTDTKLLYGRWRGIRLGFLSSMKEYLS